MITLPLPGDFYFYVICVLFMIGLVFAPVVAANVIRKVVNPLNVPDTLTNYALLPSEVDGITVSDTEKTAYYRHGESELRSGTMTSERIRYYIQFIRAYRRKTGHVWAP